MKLTNCFLAVFAAFLMTACGSSSDSSPTPVAPTTMQLVAEARSDIEITDTTIQTFSFDESETVREFQGYEVTCSAYLRPATTGFALSLNGQVLDFNEITLTRLSGESEGVTGQWTFESEDSNLDIKVVSNVIVTITEDTMVFRNTCNFSKL